MMKNPIFIALDVNEWGKALELAQELSPLAGGFKVGPRLSLKATPLEWQKLADYGPIFYDPKFYDIPNTMVESLRACADKGISYVTIHAGSGLKAMSQVAKLEQELNTSQFFKVLGVTVLTSFDGTQNPIPGFTGTSLDDAVLTLTDLVAESGLTGVVCAGHEVSKVKYVHPDFFTVVPGIRLKEDSIDDQARVLEPQKALELGADAIVVGRSVINEAYPKAKLQKYLDLLR